MFDLKPNRVRAFTGPGAERRAERVGHWFKAMAGIDQSRDWCIENGVALTKAAVEGVDSAGGFLAPQDFDDAIIVVREQVGAFRRGAQVTQARSENKVRPRRIGGLTANFVAEGAAIPESSFQLDAVEASLKKLAILARSSVELFEDSAPDLGEFLTSEIAYAFAAKEDDAGFNGDGTSTYFRITGLANKLAGLKSAIAAASGVHTFATITATDIGNLMGGVLGSAIAGAAWYINPVGFGQCFCRLATGSGGGYLETREVDGILTPYCLGFPVIFSGKLPDGSSSMTGVPMIYFGSLTMSSVIVERRQTVIATSFDRALENAQVLVRGVERVDVINHTVGDASTRGPIAALVGTA